MKRGFGMKKLLAVFLSILFVSTTFSTVSANQFARITHTTIAQVINVIDGDSMRVRNIHTGEIALVRLLCVDATGRDDAFNYLTARLTGKRVTLETDSYVNQFTDRWNLVYVTYNGQSVNADMLANGYGVLNESHRSASRYRQFARNQDDARENEVGRWAPEEPEGMHAYSGNGVNINTATAEQLQNILNGVNATTARNIVRFREKNPFRRVGDIKFVDGFTRTIFDNNRRFMTVSTNINTASREELSTLTDVTNSMIEKLLDHRADSNFRSLSILYARDIFPYDVYNLNEPFMSTANRSTIEHTVPNRIVNINTATHSQLTGVGFSSRQADALIEHRARYGYKTIEELMFVPGVAIARTVVDEIYNNLTVRTDINNAPITEIRSLLGSNNNNANDTANRIERNRRYRNIEQLRDHVSDSVYNSFRPYVYINASDAVPTRVNLNTATREQLLGIGLSASQAASIESSRPINHPGRLTVDTSPFDLRVALYTNINEATLDELRTLHTRMTDDYIDAIVDYRRVQPFASQNELRDFFANQLFITSIYNDIRDFVVFR